MYVSIPLGSNTISLLYNCLVCCDKYRWALCQELWDFRLSENDAVCDWIDALHWQFGTIGTFRRPSSQRGEGNPNRWGTSAVWWPMSTALSCMAAYSATPVIRRPRQESCVCCMRWVIETSSALRVGHPWMPSRYSNAGFLYFAKWSPYMVLTHPPVVCGFYPFKQADKLLCHDSLPEEAYDDFVFRNA